MSNSGRRRRWGGATFGSDAGGNVALLFALALGILVLAIGAGLEMRDWLRARSQTRAAVDAALISGLRALQIDRLPRGAAMQVAQQAYLDNVRGRRAMLADGISFSATDEDTAVEASGRVAMRTRLLGLLGVGSLTVVDLSGADVAKAIRTVGLNAMQSLETVLIVALPSRLDAGALDGLKAAARMLADLIVWPLRQGRVSRLGLVPFSTAVNAGALARLVSQPTSPIATFTLVDGSSARLRASECVAERVTAAAFTDEAPTGADQLSTLFSRTGSCEPSARVQLPTTDRSTLDAAIGAFAAGGGVAGHVGLAWGWYLLSPHWSGTLPFEAPPAAYAAVQPMAAGGRAKVRKIAIIVADGVFDTQACVATLSSGSAAAVLPDHASPAGLMPKGNCASPNGPSARQALAICDAMKRAGLTVITVTYPAGKVASDPDVMSLCASDVELAYRAAGSGELLLVVRTIAMQVTTLLVTR